MVLGLVAVMVVAAPQSVAVLPIRNADFIGTQLSDQLGRTGLKVVELAAADAMVAGACARNDEGLQLTIAVSDAKSAKVLVTRRLSASTEAGVLDGLSLLAAQLAAALEGREPPEAPSRVKIWLPLFVAGAGGLGLSTILFTQSVRQTGDANSSLSIAGSIAGAIGLGCAVGGLIALLLPERYRISVAVVPIQDGAVFAFGLSSAVGINATHTDT